MMSKILRILPILCLLCLPAFALDRVPVKSSNIKTIGWESGTLEIEFHSGGIYQYSDVPAAIYTTMLDAPSKGKYFHKNIKDRYEFRRIK